MAHYVNLITSESVGAGHPDKICDQISDHILDACLKNDPYSRVACEVFASNHLIVIGGEITTNSYVDVVKCAWDVVLPLGYNENEFTIISNVNSQSPDISQTINKSDGQIGAGDQGIVYGYATNETKTLMPLSIVLAHELVKRAEHLRKTGKFKWAKSDMKSQVTIDYNNPKKPVDTVLMSIQHDENYKPKEFAKFIKDEIIMKVLKEYKVNLDPHIIINPSGKFVVGGPIGDTGLTGRKIIVDTYGGISRHGGGAFSGKDCTKVDRSGAYMARYIAKNIVAAGLADKCEVQLAFGIGLTEPIAIYVDCFGTNKISVEEIIKIIHQVFDLSVAGFIENLNLRKPQFRKLATYGHFGREELNVAWEALDKVNAIKKLIK